MAKRIAQMNLQEAQAGLYALELAFQRAQSAAISGDGAGFRRAAFHRNHAKYLDRIEAMKAAERKKWAGAL
jgi:hypothetical protein